MSTQPLTEGPVSPLRLLPAYLGTSGIGEAIQTERGRRMLWLKILVNDQLDLAPWQSRPAVQVAYRTACRWYTRCRRLITFLGDQRHFLSIRDLLTIGTIKLLPRPSLVSMLTADSATP